MCWADWPRLSMLSSLGHGHPAVLLWLLCLHAPLQTGYTFLPCVLAGLARAPQLVPRSPVHHSPWAALQADTLAAGAHLQVTSSALWAEDVDCVVLPSTAFGGAGTQALSRRKKVRCRS